jgi:hypothetical protein
MRSLAATHERIDHLNRALEHHQQMVMMMMNSQWSHPHPPSQYAPAAAAAAHAGVGAASQMDPHPHAAAMLHPQAHGVVPPLAAPAAVAAQAPTDLVSRLGQLRAQLFSRFERAQVLGLEPHHVIGRGLAKLSGAQHDGLVDVLEQLLAAAKTARDASKSSSLAPQTAASDHTDSGAVVQSAKPRGVRNKTVWSRKQRGDAARAAASEQPPTASSAAGEAAAKVAAEDNVAASAEAAASAGSANSVGSRDPKLGRFKPYAASAMPITAGNVAWGDEEDDEALI